MRILIAYATRHGSTRGIAERVAAVLAESGFDIALREVGDIDSLDRYDAFVIGSAAYMGGWLAEATTFVREHRDDLAGQPVWLFSSGPIGAEPLDAKGRDQLVASRPKEFAEFARELEPRDARVFFGAWDPEAPPVGLAEGLMTRIARFLPAAKEAMPAGDFRDWPAIERWARGIAAQLDQAAVGAGT
jgi:menaquinone-dependent protoporphyrinogen oxidase